MASGRRNGRTVNRPVSDGPPHGWEDDWDSAEDSVYDEPEDLSQWTVARMAAWLTPRQAAHVKYMAAMLREGSVIDEHSARIDAVINGNPGHRMFMYCLDAVAREARDE